MNAWNERRATYWGYFWIVCGSLCLWLACQPSAPATPDILETPLEAKPATASEPTDSNDPEAASQKSFLWEVSSPTAKVYLLGSIHVARQDLYPLAAPIEKAYQASSRLVLELHLTPEVEAEAVKKSMQLGLYPEGDSVDRHLSKEAWQRYARYLDTKGKPVAAFARMKPWLASLGLVIDALQKDGFVPALGIDRYFQEKAEKDSKPIESLETVDEQLGTLANQDDKLQELMLLDFLDTQDELVPQMEGAFVAWRAGNAEGVEKLLLSSVTRPEFEPLHQKLFVERNQRMTAKLREYLKKTGNSLMIVGSGHLVGDLGIVNLIAKDHPVQQL
jgi:uncharacterized protein YbaP (TraB family)